MGQNLKNDQSSKGCSEAASSETVPRNCTTTTHLNKSSPLRRESDPLLLQHQQPNDPAITTPLNWKISDFDVGRLLGAGKFGRVYLAREKSKKTIIAIKSIKKEDIRKERIKYQLVREIEIQKNLHH